MMKLSHENLYTLCSSHHKHLHSIYGQTYSNHLAPKIKNWLDIQRAKNGRYEEIKGFRKWVADRLKLNPAQPSIASLEPYASPETIVDFEQAYREIEVVHRSVDMIINACNRRFLLLLMGQSPSKKVNKLLNIKPNPFEDRVKII
jgi:hypothetical protein